MARLRQEDAEARAGSVAGRDFSEALARGLKVMTAFRSQATPMTLSDVARAVDLPRATVRRALLTLRHLGYVEDDGRLFRLTPRVLTLAGAYLESNIASAVLQPACEALAAAHGEIFSVAVLDGDAAMMVAYARPRSIYMLGGGIGLRIPAHCTAVGRVLLTGIAPADRDAFLDTVPLTPATPRTVTDRSVLDALLWRIGIEDHAMVEEEAELGFRSIAVPLRRRDGRVGFALNIGMPIARASSDEALALFLPILRAEAARLGDLLI